MVLAENAEWQKAQRGELYHAFARNANGAELVQYRARCARACQALNSSTDPSRREQVRLWRDITDDKRPLPPAAATPEADDELFLNEPWVEAPMRADYGVNVILGQGMFLNFNSTFVDTCPIRIGARTLVGPHCSFYSGTHPLDPAVRNGLAGPETGRPINIGDDCWIGGNVIVLPGVTIGRGSTVGAGSVVTKDVPPFHVVAGNPARILRKIESALHPSDAGLKQDLEGAEVPMSES
jgi:acetyltransferase-like isoleucine patch superfamily enzyme